MDETLTALAAGADGPDPLAALRAAAELRRELDRREAVAVRRARVQGVLWTDIAGALGVSKQAVHKKYGGNRLLPGNR
ncbi:DNA invertase Pin-like site-specific DNA recombinase [Prauserella isguenensis]|uniref:DNA invertase Pin-like site-specific DNA recombinase n=1 Tax=Prauserella isguenensis TaxID=1470180 RepID=A0A839RYU4_9PSEU|nr:hypothetical protein [Prauserella isguenensis]MBB3050951.1 DNA invertase Pin-like site-specific DNA recombinase [Prauserella isguenensis]